MKSIYNLLVIIMLILLWGFWYFWYQTYDFSSLWLGFEVPNSKSVLIQASGANADLQSQIDKIRSSSQIAQFEVAKIIDTKAPNTNRYQNFDQLTNIYTKLASVNKNYLDIKEYYINNNDFAVNGKVATLNMIYNKWAILDIFRNTNIFDDINSPKNNKQDNSQSYNFDIKWEFKTSQVVQN